MIDLLVELVLHPGCDAGPLEQPAGERDEIVEIQRGGLAFAPVVGLEHRRADAQQRRRALGDAGGLLALDPAGQARLLRTQGGCLVREGDGGDEIPLPGLPILGQKDALVGGPGAHALLGRGGEPVGDGLRTCRVLVGAARERAGGGGQARLIQRRVGRRGVAYLPGIGADGHAERGAHGRDQPLDLAAMARQRRAQAEPVLAQGIQAFGQGPLAQQHGEAAKRGADIAAAARQHLRLRLAQQIRGAARVEHLEMGHHAGLEREALEQRLAEAVDGHDRQAGGQVEDLGEQDARARPLRGRGRAAEQIREVRLPAAPPARWPAGRAPAGPAPPSRPPPPW